MERGTFERYGFENLEVWQLGMRIVREIYQVIEKFPKTETFALSDQLRRAAVSIVLNIAEGSGQPTSKGFILYIQRSKSSVLECVACIKVAIQEDFISEDKATALQDLFQTEYFKLIALAKSIKKP